VAGFLAFGFDMDYIIAKLNATVYLG